MELCLTLTVNSGSMNMHIINRSITAESTPHPIIFGWSNRKEWDRRGM